MFLEMGICYMSSKNVVDYTIIQSKAGIIE